MYVKSFLAVLAGFVVVTSSTFVIPVASAGQATEDNLEPQSAQETFDQSVTTGMTREDINRNIELNGVIPRAVAYYSQYTNIIGYYRIEALTSDLQREHHERQFGQPFIIYVSDFSNLNPGVNQFNLLEIQNQSHEGPPGMVVADKAYFVVESRAQTYGGENISVPFSDEESARDYMQRNGGRIVRWDELQEAAIGEPRPTRSEWQSINQDREAWADETVAESRSMLERPVSVEVGRDAPTVGAAIEEAPPNTTVLVPPGTYNVSNILVDKPITIRGAGNETVLVGEANETTFQFYGPRTAITSLRITAVGDRNPRTRTFPQNFSGPIETTYTIAHPAIRYRAHDGLVEDVHIQPASTGLVFSGSNRSVVNNVTIVGDQPWTDGYTSIMGFRSRLVVQNSDLLHGRGGFYFHRSQRGVIRNNYMEGMRSGFRSELNSHTYLANNTVRHTVLGVHALTRQDENSIVHNDIRLSGTGIGDAGRGNYLAENVLIGNDRGMRVQGSHSLYTRNVVAYNRQGVLVGQIVQNVSYFGTIVPTTEIVENDFIGNERHVRSEQLGPLQIWTADGRGNYWSGAPGVDWNGDGTLDREFRVTGLVDSRSYRVRGGRTLSLSPAVVAMRSLQAVVPGLQSTGVLDTAPLAEPVHPEYLEESVTQNDTARNPNATSNPNLRRAAQT